MTAFFAAITTMVFVSSANPCSMCLCGDRLYLYGHGDQLQPGKFSISFENRYFSKSSGGTEAGSEAFEKQREYRPSIVLAYGLKNDFTVTASMSGSFKRLEETEMAETEIEKISGLGDLQLEGMWNNKISEDLARSYVLGMFLAVKAPTGANDKAEDDVRLDEHGQPGTGSWDFNAGMGLTRISNTHSGYITAFYRVNGTNDYEYHFGNMTSLNIGGDYRPKPSYALTMAVNGRYASRDEEDGLTLQNTGGWVFYLTPGVRFDFQRSLGIIANLQIPVYEDLYEDQDENAVFNLTFRYDVL
ncbi:MAG: hypothetical protein ACREBV_00820 [Candidatus Zixiibacteriota bacterium]